VDVDSGGNKVSLLQCSRRCQQYSLISIYTWFNQTFRQENVSLIIIILTIDDICTIQACSSRPPHSLVVLLFGHIVEKTEREIFMVCKDNTTWHH
jgi:hypothetical protein